MLNSIRRRELIVIAEISVQFALGRLDADCSYSFVNTPLGWRLFLIAVAIFFGTGSQCSQKWIWFYVSICCTIFFRDVFENKKQ